MQRGDGEQGEAGETKWESVSFSLSHSQPLMLSSLLLPHSLSPLLSHSRRCCCRAWKPLPSSLAAHSHALSHSAYTLLHRRRTDRIWVNACGALDSQSKPVLHGQASGMIAPNRVVQIEKQSLVQTLHLKSWRHQRCVQHYGFFLIIHLFFLKRNKSSCKML